MCVGGGVRVEGDDRGGRGGGSVPAPDGPIMHVSEEASTDPHTLFRRGLGFWSFPCSTVMDRSKNDSVFARGPSAVPREASGSSCGTCTTILILRVWGGEGWGRGREGVRVRTMLIVVVVARRAVVIFVEGVV